MRWEVKPQPAKESINALATALNVNKLLATLLILRGVYTYDEAKNFFRPSLQDLHDPFLMKDMHKAVERILNAINNSETIMVFGDYDVDGTTAVSLMAGYLTTFYPNVVTYIPDRYAEGYGISYQGIDFADDNDISLIIALDCGIKSIDHIHYASSKNIDFIICDHHKPGAIVPKAHAVLDPQQTDCSYPYTELSGCGVGFKLIQALQQTRNQPFEELIPFLDLVAISIAADIVPIDGENRILAFYGLQILNQSPRTGIKALLAEVTKKELTITDVVFKIAPKINAAGRIHHGNHAVALLMETNLSKAQNYAKEITDFNSNRKELDKTITSAALQQIEQNNETALAATVVFNENWHKGVIGIVASRLIETYYKPTLVFTKSGDYLAASARSVAGFDVYNALENSATYLEQFGGHKYAAGLTIKPENYQLFKTDFINTVEKTITEAQKTPLISIDAEISFDDMDDKFHRILNQFSPFGPANMKPVFVAKNVSGNHISLVGADKSHLKLTISQNNCSLNAIGFGLGKYFDKINTAKTFDIVFTIEENEWNHLKTIQLNLKDIGFNS